MKKYPFVSVIIPTYNRAKILQKSLFAFSEQNYPKEKFEVIVVDDGIADKGPATARNLGIKTAQGEIVIFVNDDIVPEKNFIAQHANSHLAYPQKNIGVIGFVDWSPELKLTPFMQWLGEKGPQFSYSQIKGTWAEWWQAWTCNISFKKEFLLKVGLFDPSFKHAAWEDIELGYRMSKHKLKLFYNKQAVGYHYHPMNIRLIKEKMKINGASAVILGQKIPEQKFLPPLARNKAGRVIDFLDRIFLPSPIVYIMEKIVFWAEERLRLGFIYNLLLLHYRVIGRREYLQKCLKD